MKYKQTLLIIASIIIAVVNIAGVILYQRYKSIEDSENWVQHTQTVIVEALDMRNNVERMVASERGYLLSGAQVFLDNYYTVREKAYRQIELLGTLVTDNPEQKQRLVTMRATIDEMVSLLEAKIKVQRENPAALHDFVQDRILINKELADKLRALILEMRTDEENLLRGRLEEVHKQEEIYFRTLVVATIVGMFVLLLSNGLVLRMATRQRATETTLAVAEKDLAEAKERLELALKGTADGIFDWYAGEEEMYLSPRFKDMLGYGDNGIPNTVEGFNSLLHPDDKEQVWDYMRRYMKGEYNEYRNTFRLRHRDGSWRWHLARATAIFDGDSKQAIRLVGAHTDITDQKALEDHLKASNKELEEFTYIASHDLRSPLVNMKGFAGELEYAAKTLRPFVDKALETVDYDDKALVRETMDKDIPQAVGFIKSSVTKMDKLTQAILELSRVGRRELRIQELNVEQIVDNCLKALQHQINNRKAEVIVGTLPSVRGDAVAIEQVFGNIIDNAVKYLSPDRPGRIEISGVAGASETTFQVRDNGRGIAPEDISKIFEIFKRAGNNLEIPGEGIGMSYVQATVRRHGGNIWCTSEVGKGTCFYFTISHNLKSGVING